MANTENTASKKWSDESVATLTSIVGNVSPVSAETVNKAAEVLGVSVRSVASKLRSLDLTVASMAAVKTPSFTESESASLRTFVEQNAGTMTYSEIAKVFADGKFTAKQVQGKILALELTGSVKATEKVAAVRTYSEAEEAKFVSLAKSGAFIEDIAKALDRPLPSVRGKALSLSRAGVIDAIPAQKESHAKESVDVVAALGAEIATMTVEQIVTATGKTERGVKTLLTRRGIKVADYDGEAKQAKARAA
jgi:predicted HTH domain antitoxin